MALNASFPHASCYEEKLWNCAIAPFKREYFPVTQKRSIIVPVIKADGLDNAEPMNHRPIANVTFLY